MIYPASLSQFIVTLVAETTKTRGIQRDIYRDLICVPEDLCWVYFIRAERNQVL